MAKGQKAMSQADMKLDINCWNKLINNIDEKLKLRQHYWLHRKLSKITPYCISFIFQCLSEIIKISVGCIKISKNVSGA